LSQLRHLVLAATAGVVVLFTVACGNVRVNEIAAGAGSTPVDGATQSEDSSSDGASGLQDGGGTASSGGDGAASSGASGSGAGGDATASGSSGGDGSGRGSSSGPDGKGCSGDDAGASGSSSGTSGGTSGGADGGAQGQGDAIDGGGGSSSGSSSSGSDASGGCVADKECGVGSLPPTCLRHICNSGACKLVDEIDGELCPWTGGKIPACHEPTCQQGKCQLTNATDGSLCGSKCTIKSGLKVWASSICKVGKCAEQPAENCDDGSSCTKDSCNVSKGCLHTTAPGACNDNNPCTDDKCDGVTGCQNSHNIAACDDGDKCTASDKCLAGTCIGSTAVCPCKADNDCTTVNPCRPASCGAQGKCVSKPAAKIKCDDASSCTTNDHCDGVGNCTGTKLVCTDGVACTNDTCAVGSGCKYLPDSPACDDGNPCTTSQCEKTGCKYGNNDGVPCDDGNKCSSDGVCNTTKCLSGIAKSCFDDNSCTSDACDKATGKCVYIPLKAGSGCSDGDQCTLQDTCAGGKCAGKSGCDDGNSCTKDTCNPKAGCAHLVTDGAPCDDGDTCTLSDTCNKDLCIAKSTKKCEDGNPCTVDSCTSGKGCVAKPGNAGAECGGGSAPLACIAGKCTSFKIVAGTKWVKAKVFKMGCNAQSDGQCSANEKPAVTVAQSGFFVDKTEVTAQQYKFCVLSAKCTDAKSTGADATYNKAAKQEHPINYVTWQQASGYCATKNGRLCTEAEWELAARGALSLVYPWGNSAPNCKLAVFSGCGTGPVKADSVAAGASPWGVVHMAGNVREWVSDWYDGNWYSKKKKAQPVSDPKGPKFGNTKVVRGGYFASGATQIRASARGFVGPKISSGSIGFRCCHDFK
jgi:formylglycine-generating enzyme required for sulfatase activity